MTNVKPAQRITSCGDVSCEFLVDPIPRPRPLPITVTYAPAVRRVVLVDSQKPNSLAIMRRTQTLLRERGVDVRDEIIAKPSAGIAMESDMLDRLAEWGELVVSGVND